MQWQQEPNFAKREAERLIVLDEAQAFEICRRVLSVSGRLAAGRR
jgi:hypothetical protein